MLNVDFPNQASQIGLMEGSRCKILNARFLSRRDYGPGLGPGLSPGLSQDLGA